jgi:hypothetical protein
MKFPDRQQIRSWLLKTINNFLGQLSLTGIVVFVGYWLIVFSGSMYEPLETASTLEEQGYTNITIVGYSYPECDHSQIYRTRFEAYTQTGKKRTGVMCNSPFMGSEIRWDDDKTFRNRILNVFR